MGRWDGGMRLLALRVWGSEGVSWWRREMWVVMEGGIREEGES